SAAALMALSASSYLPSAYKIQAVATCHWMSTCSAQYASLAARSFSRSSASLAVSALAASACPGRAAPGARAEGRMASTVGGRGGKVGQGSEGSERGGQNCELRRRIPIAALDRVARRAPRQRIGPGNERLGEAADPAHLLDDRLRFRTCPICR